MIQPYFLDYKSLLVMFVSRSPYSDTILRDITYILVHFCAELLHLTNIYSLRSFL